MSTNSAGQLLSDMKLICTFVFRICKKQVFMMWLICFAAFLQGSILLLAWPLFLVILAGSIDQEPT